LVGFRHLMSNRSATVSIQEVAKASNCRQVAIAAVVGLFTAIHKPELLIKLGNGARP
jgi:hypothetical protein